MNSRDNIFHQAPLRHPVQTYYEDFLQVQLLSHNLAVLYHKVPRLSDLVLFCKLYLHISNRQDCLLEHSNKHNQVHNMCLHFVCHGFHIHKLCHQKHVALHQVHFPSMVNMDLVPVFSSKLILSLYYDLSNNKYLIISCSF